MSNARDMPNCSDFPSKVGDKGQRYEIRFYKAVHEELSPGVETVKRGQPKVFGWSSRLEGAHTMLGACGLAPWAVDPWIVDREALTVRKLIEELGKVTNQDALIAVASLDSSSEYPWENAVAVGVLPDGRVVID